MTKEKKGKERSLLFLIRLRGAGLKGEEEAFSLPMQRR